jgi:tetratricopeptide (TPR) repeat protein
VVEGYSLKDGKESDADVEQPKEPAPPNDWAAAVERWVQGGFKAEEMPEFIRSGVEEQPPDSEQEQNATEPAEKVEGVADVNAPLASVAPAPKPEVPLLDDIVQGFLAAPAKVPATDAPEKVVAPPPEKEKATESQSVAVTEPALIVEPAQPRVRRSLLLRTLGWPPPLAFGLGVLVVGLAALVWRLFIYENPQTISFPMADSTVEVIPAPVPSDYPARPKAAFHYSRGNRFAYLGRFTEAIAEYQQALREDPDYPHPHRALGACYAALGDGSLAATSYRNYLKLASEGPDAASVREILKRYPGK